MRVRRAGIGIGNKLESFQLFGKLAGASPKPTCECSRFGVEIALQSKPLELRLKST